MVRVALVGSATDGFARVAPRIPALTVTNLEEAEAVVIAGADPTAHVPQAARARKHILLGAPLGSTLEAADRLLTECSNAAVRLMVANSARFLPSVRAIKSTLESGKLGQPGLLRSHRWEPRSQSTLGAQSRTLGADLWQLATEELDLARWIFGRRPNELCVVGKSEGLYLQLHLGFPDGGMALIDAATSLPAGAGYTSRSLIASTGAAYSDDHHNMQLVYRGGAPSALRTTEGDAGTLALLQEFVEVASGKEPSCTAAEARDAVMIAEAAAKCLSTGRTARLTGDRYELV